MILPIGAVHDHRPPQSQGINRQMPLAASDLFSRIVASFFASFRRANRLTVHDRHAGRRFLAALLTDSSAECLMDPLPDSISTPTPEDSVNSLPLGKIMRQRSPLATGSIEVQDRIEDQTPTNGSPATLRLLGQQTPQHLPLSVIQIAGILLAHRYGSVFLDLRTKKAET